MGSILVGCVMETKWTEHRGSVIGTKWQEMGTRCGDHLRVDVDATQYKMWTPFDGRHSRVDGKMKTVFPSPFCCWVCSNLWSAFRKCILKCLSVNISRAHLHLLFPFVYLLDVVECRSSLKSEPQRTTRTKDMKLAKYLEAQSKGKILSHFSRVFTKRESFRNCNCYVMFSSHVLCWSMVTCWICSVPLSVDSSDSNVYKQL